MKSTIASYFRAVFAGVPETGNLQYCEVSLPDWSPQPNCCHDNAEYWAARNAQFEVVRGWVVIGDRMVGAHSVLYDRDVGKLIDITPMRDLPELRRFVRHEGTEEEFGALKGPYSVYYDVS